MAEQGEPGAAGQKTPWRESLAFTLKSNGEILKFESVDAVGNRRELSKTEISDVAKQIRGPGVEELLEGAFEAGIACLLDGEDRKDDGAETEDEAGVRRILLDSLMEGSAAARAMRPEVLREAIVRTLIHNVTRSEQGKGGAASGQS
jgi:hypothetical protein